VASAIRLVRRAARWLTWANGGLQGAVGVITMSIGIRTIVATVFA
jgi:hypothetical protein